MKTKVTNFLLTISNPDREMLEKCPQYDKNRFAMMGLILLLLFLLSLFSSFFAIHEANLFDDTGFQFLLALLIAFIIFNIDRYIVMSFNIEKNIIKRIFNLSFFTRLILSILIGIIISKPIEIKLLEDKINNEIINRQLQEQNKFHSNTFKVGVEESKLNHLDKELQNIQKEIDKNKNEIQDNQVLLNTYNKGWYWLKITDKEGNEKRIKQLTSLGKQAQENINRLTQLNEHKQRQYDSLYASTQKLYNEYFAKQNQIKKYQQNLINSKKYTLLEKISILGELSDKDITIRLTVWLIMSFFIMLDCLPLMFKTLNYSFYDILMNEKLKQFQYQQEIESLQKEKEIYQQKYTKQLEEAENQFNFEKEQLKRKFELDMEKLDRNNVLLLKEIQCQKERDIAEINKNEEIENLKRQHYIENFDNIMKEYEYKHKEDILNIHQEHEKNKLREQNKYESDRSKIKYSENLKGIAALIHQYQNDLSENLKYNIHNNE